MNKTESILALLFLVGFLACRFAPRAGGASPVYPCQGLEPTEAAYSVEGVAATHRGQWVTYGQDWDGTPTIDVWDHPDDLCPVESYIDVGANYRR